MPAFLQRQPRKARANVVSAQHRHRPLQPSPLKHRQIRIEAGLSREHAEPQRPALHPPEVQLDQRSLRHQPPRVIGQHHPQETRLKDRYRRPPTHPLAGLKHVPSVPVRVDVNVVRRRRQTMLVRRTQPHAARIDQPLSQHPGLIQGRQVRVTHRNLRVMTARPHRRIENRVRPLRQHLAPGVDVRLRIMPTRRRPTARHDHLVVVVVVHNRRPGIHRPHPISRNLLHRTRRVRIPRLRSPPIDRRFNHHRLGHGSTSIRQAVYVPTTIPAPCSPTTGLNRGSRARAFPLSTAIHQHRTSILYS